MTNRQDRRYAAKLARQAAKRGRTAAERALFAAAGAYAADRPMALDFTLDGFDAAWRQLEDDLIELLEADYDTFRQAVFAEAAWAPLAAPLASGETAALDLSPILFPVAGRRENLRGFLGTFENREALAASLRLSGLFPEETTSIVLPLALEGRAVDLASAGPAAVAQLTRALAERVVAAGPAGEAAADAAVEAAARAAGLPLVDVAADGQLPACLVLGATLAPMRDAAAADDITEEEVEALHLAAVATRASWLDSYAADLPIRLGEPAFWPEAGPALAWHEVAGEIEAEAARRGLPDPIAQIHACLLPEAGDPVVAALCGAVMLGPFRAPAALVSVDLDGFAAFAEDYAGELVEHDRPEDVLRLIGPATTPGPADDGRS